MARSKHSVQQKLDLIQMVEEAQYTVHEICKIYEISVDTLYRWKTKYQTEGIEGLKESSSWKPYTKELKIAAVDAVLSGKLTRQEVLMRYRISSNSVLARWISKYTSHSELKDSGKGMSQTMTKSRKTTKEERLEIVRYCLNHQRDYRLTATTYDVSYQQVYGWVKKFDLVGDAGLEDGRGRTKAEAELTEEEKLKLRIQQMERENERLRTENLFLKKLEEIERRR